MRKVALAVAVIASQAVVSFAGPPPPKEVVPMPPPPPQSYFRPNEFDIGVFGTYFTGTSNNPTGTRNRFVDVPGFPTQTLTTTLSGEATVTGWGGGMDFSYYFPWKYLGVRFQGAGLSLSTGNFTVTENLNGVREASRTGSLSTSAGIITTDLILRLPLDDFWPSVHLAPYGFGGFGAIFGGGGGSTINTRFPELNARFNSQSSSVKGRPIGNIGGGLEYRFTPHIGIFAEAGYNIVDGPNNNFVQTNFGLRFAF
jgi:hypothetical protein